MMKRTDTYRFTVAVTNGNITDPSDISNLQALRDVIALSNAEASAFGLMRRDAVRLRYRGPRKGRHNGQSMCLRSDAYAADVYVYSEPR